MTEQDGNAYKMTYNRGCRRTGNAPSKELNENDVEAEVNCVVDDNRQRYQFRLTIHTHHRRESPHEDEGGITQQENLHVITCQGKDLFVTTQQMSCLIGKQQSSENGEQYANAHTQRKCTREESPCICYVLLSKSISNQHSSTSIDE